MLEPEQYPFVSRASSGGDASLFPFLPLTLTFRETSLSSEGLLDTASMVNVLPYHVGLRLGAIWEKQTTRVPLAGNLAQVEARGLLLQAKVGNFPPVRLAFAWTKSDAVPLLLGQINFFLEFDVCFFRSRSVFEIKPK
jgi:hypothetical protein